MITDAQLNEAKQLLPKFEDFLFEPAPIQNVQFRVKKNIDALLPSSSIHATGIGLSQSRPNSLAFVIFKFADSEDTLPAGYKFEGLPVEVDVLPRMQAGPAAQPQAEGGPAQQISPAGIIRRVQPICGGASISPLGKDYAGTLGALVEHQGRLCVLSNNHVLADIDSLPMGSEIGHPALDGRPDEPAAFAALSKAIPLKFPTSTQSEMPVNHFDAAWAQVTDASLVQTGKMLGDLRYNPTKVLTPVPGMRVIKMGRTTGVTRGMILGVALTNVRVNYGLLNKPRYAIFNSVVRIVGNGQAPFSLPGDSGSVVLEEATGHPVAMIFAGSAQNSTACDLQALCSLHGLTVR